MPATSTVYATKVALLALLKANTDLGAATDPVAVWWARPNWEHSYTENVYVEDADDTLDWAQLGAQRRDENYDITVGVEVYRAGTDAQGTEARMWTLVHAIETAVAADVTLAGAVIDARVSRIQQSVEPMGEGYTAAADISVSVHARP